MDFKEHFDEVLSELLADGIPLKGIAQILMDEGFCLEEDGDVIPLMEVVRRRRRKVGGFNVTVRKIGRPNPARSMKARQTARRFASKRKMAARRFSRSSRGKRMRQVMRQVRRSKGGSRPRPRRSGPPRRRASPRVARRRRR